MAEIIKKFNIKKITIKNLLVIFLIAIFIALVGVMTRTMSKTIKNSLGLTSVDAANAQCWDVGAGNGSVGSVGSEGSEGGSSDGSCCCSGSSDCCW